MGLFHDQVVLITGAAGNLGTATAALFRAEGARLALLDRRLEKLDAAFAGWEAHREAVDLTVEESVNEAVANVVAALGRIDVLANIGGGFRMGPPLHETALETWEFMMDLNARSVFLMCRAVIPHMLAGGHGKIVNIGARPGLGANARMGPYSASKSAVIRLTEAMAGELKHEGINVNCILPSIIDTPQNRKSSPDADFSRWVTPASIAGVIRFLCSADAADIQGAAIPVYGRS